MTANGSVELAIAAMALDQKAPSFDSGHGRNISIRSTSITSLIHSHSHSHAHAH